MISAANQIILEDTYLTQVVNDCELRSLLKQGDILYDYFFTLEHFL